MGGAGRSSTRSRDFVGRASDLEALRAAVEAARDGSGCLVLLAGEPGIGKTRLALEATAHAADAGLAVRRSACWEGEGAPAYWPWVQLIRAHAAERGPDGFARDVGPYADDIVHLFPDLRLYPDLAPDTVSAAAREHIGEQPRFRLFDAVASVLRRAAAEQPLLLVIDDLHWADVGSAMLLRFCARELADAPVLMLAAFRDLEVDPRSELGRIMGSLQQDASTRVLAGLERAEVRQLLARTLGDEDAERITAEVHERSGGNPLFVRELGRLFSSTDDTASTSIPENIRAVLNRRLFRLSVDAVDLLRIASAAGEEFDLDLLVGASSQQREAVLELLDEALRTRLIREISGVRPRFAFVHALVRDSLYDRLTLAERARVHLRIGDALERRPDDAPVAELARHFLKATGSAGGDLRGIDYSERAGEQAFEHLAYEDAATHFTHALEALPVTGENDERRARLLCSLGRARVRGGDITAAREAFERAAADARRMNRPDVLAEAAIGFGASLGGFEVRLSDRGQTDLLEEALRVLGPGDSSLRAQVMALLSIALTYSESTERRRQLAAEAAGMARRTGNTSALVIALGAYCDTISGPDHSEDRLAVANEMVEASVSSRDPSMELLGRRHRLVALLELADIAAVEAEIDAYEATARTVRQPIYLWCVPMWRGMRALMLGRFEDAEQLSDEVARIGEQAGSDNAAILSKVLRWACLREQHRLKEVYELLLAQLNLTPGKAGESYWVGLVVGAEFPEEAEAAVARVSVNDYAEFPVDAVWTQSMCAVAEACAIVGDLVAAEKAYELLLPYASRFVVDGIATVCHGSAARYLGILAGVLGRLEDAQAHFEAALEANRRAGATALVAATRHEYGVMLARAGEHARAGPLLREAAHVFRTLGAPLRAEAAERYLPGTASLDPDTNIFRREGEIWTLAYAGRTARLKDSKGLRDIATLLDRPGREVHVADLIAATEGNAPAVASLDDPPILDERARAEYRERVEQLRDELEDAERFGDAHRAERARTEMDLIAGELASALGLGGRARTMSNPAERARKAVAQRVRNALRRIEREHAELARHLDRSLRTGSFCAYEPERPTVWSL